jgi:hypothetical protein
MNLRIFGGKDCEVCSKLTKNLMAMSIKFLFVDAFEENTQTLCDENDVTDLPHIQVLSDDGKVFWQGVGDVSLTKILRHLKANEKSPPNNV